MGDVAFGTLTPGGGTDGTANGSVEWRCSNGTNADINIDDGGNTNRTMDHASTASTLAFQLFKDAARTLVWSNSGTDPFGIGYRYRWWITPPKSCTAESCPPISTRRNPVTTAMSLTSQSQ